MKLFRFTDTNYKDIEAVTIDQLDLKNKKTLFIFPGADNPAPPFPPPEGYDHGKDPNKYKKIKHLLDLGVVSTQDCMQPTDEPFQVVLANWEGTEGAKGKAITEECLGRLEKARDNPGTFISPEAQQFVDELYKHDFDDNKISALGWSYGTCFLQECANAIRKDEKEIKRTGPRPTERPSRIHRNYPAYNPELPKIYCACASTVTDIPDSLQHGFPGIYVYAYNDEVLKKYASDAQKSIYHGLMRRANLLDRYRPTVREHIIDDPKAADELTKLEAEGRVGERREGSSAIIIPMDRDDQVMPVITAPSQFYIHRRVPVSHDEFKAGKRPQYVGANGKLSDEPQTRELVKDVLNHKPGGVLMALPGSKYIELDAEGDPDTGIFITQKEHEASEHSQYFQRALSNILMRDHDIDNQDIMASSAASALREGANAQAISELIYNRHQIAGKYPDGTLRLTLNKYPTKAILEAREKKRKETEIRAPLTRDEIRKQRQSGDDSSPEVSGR